MRTAPVISVFALLLGTGAIAIVSLLATLFWLTDRIDQTTQRHEQRTHELLLEEWLNTLTLATYDYAFWDFAYDLVLDGDAEAIYDNIGSGATESDLFDWIFLMNGQAETSFAFGPEEAGATAEDLDQANLEPFFDRLRELPPENHEMVTGFSLWNGGIAALAVAWITPNDIVEMQGADLPIMVSIRSIDADALAALAVATGVDDIAVVLGRHPEAPNQISISGPTGIVSHLSWTPLSPGRDLRAQVLPFTILLSFTILLVCLSASLFFRRQAIRLEATKRMAETDPLTDLLNRAGLQERINSADYLRRFRRGEFAAISIDLNRLKELNDTHGHEVGDQAIRITAERISRALGDNDGTAARLGGDEFVAVVLSPSPALSAQEIGERIADLCEEPIVFGTHRQAVRPAIGIALAKADADWLAVLKQSDNAMYWAKDQGIMQPVFFDRIGKVSDAA